MKNRGFWSRYRDMLMLSGLLIVFVGGIFGIGSLFSIGHGKPRTVILPDKQFNSRLAPPPSSTIQIESATKLPNDFAIYDFEVADSNTVILNRPDRSYTGIKLSQLHMDDNLLKDIATNTEYGITLSPDQSKMIYSQYRSTQAQKTTYEYDLKTGGYRKLKNDNSYSRVFVGNESYIGYDDLVFNMVDLNTGKKRELYSYDELVAKVAQVSNISSPDDTLIMLDSYEISRDLSRVYVLVKLKENYAVYSFSLNDKNDITAYTPAQDIQQFKVLKNGDMLIQGMINNEQGLYRYRADTKKFELLVKGPIWSFDLDEEESRIAYFLTLEGQKNEVHIAYLNDRKLGSDTVIYRNIDYFIKLKWNDSNLFVVGSSMEKSELYRFSFRAW
ncbi:hypothetical protein [Paenibacillus sp. BIC5C1]|uniref:hypothetical protein n=1 Tax=Paenibacillus sp. BIC5C1 TaxID=3078263 RepID=UPI0028ECA78A|nr:hypothetical protein [Paenibacillus sp. BIC5C1]